MPDSSKPRIDPAITAALIGVLGTAIVTVISLVYSNRPAPQPTPFPTWTVPPTSTLADTPAPTDTTVPGQPSSTPEPPTNTPEPTPTPPPPAIGADWANGCVSILWVPEPPLAAAPLANDCHSEPVNNVFFADAGSLKFLVDGRFDNTQVFGMYAPLPASGTASISIALTRLEDAEIWMGIFAAPTLQSQGTIIVVPPGNTQKRPLVQKTMPGQVERQKTQPFSEDSATYDVVFEFGSGSVRTTIMQFTVFDAVPVVSSQQWLFVGYQVKRGTNRIQAEFLNLAIETK